MNKINEHDFSALYDMSSGISTTKAQAGHGSPFVSFGTVFNNYFLPDELSDLMDTSEKEKEIYSVKKGDILLTRTSETVDELAMSCVALKDYSNATFSGFTKRLRPKPKGKRIAYHKYLGFYLRSYLFRQAVTNHSLMTLRSSFNEEIFALLKLYLPGYDQQVKIGDFLYAIDRKIALNDAINTELEKMAKLIYDYWFVQFDFPDAEGKPYCTSGGEMVWNEQLKREIPKGWKIDRLDKKMNMQRGVEPGSNAYSELITDTETVPFIRVNNLGCDPALYISPKAANGTNCMPNNVLVSFDGSVGKMAIAMEGAYSSGIRKITPKDSSYSDALIYFIFQSEEIQKTISKYAVGSNILHAAGAIEHLLFPYNDRIVRDFMKKIEPMYKKTVANYLQNKELTTLRDFLLPLLMNGQVTVGDIKKKAAVTPLKTVAGDDAKYKEWKTQAGIAARGGIDEQTLRNIYEAMDTNDR